MLAQANIENFATRNKILVRTNLQLSYKTNTAQLKSVLSGIESLLTSNPDIERETGYIRLVSFGPQAIELELFAFVLTASWPKFLAVREALLLHIAEVIESAGSRFAGPTHFVHLEQSPEGDYEDTREIHLSGTPPAAADDHNADPREPIREAKNVARRFA